LRVGEQGAPVGWLRGDGVEVPEDQRTLTSSAHEDLDDARAYVVLPCRWRLLRPL
jgi:hypothetical protein